MCRYVSALMEYLSVFQSTPLSRDTCCDPERDQKNIHYNQQHDCLKKEQKEGMHFLLSIFGHFPGVDCLRVFPTLLLYLKVWHKNHDE